MDEQWSSDILMIATMERNLPGQYHSYAEWSHRMKIYLVSQGLWDDTIIESPDNQQPNDHDEDRRRKNAMALLALLDACPPKARSLIMDTDSAQVAWNKLADSFRRPPESFPGEENNMNAGEENKHLRALLKHAHKGDWQSTESLLKDYPDAVNERIGRWGETALHIAVRANNVEMVKKLVNLMTPEALEMKDDHGRTAFFFAAAGGITQTATCMIDKNHNLLGIADTREQLPITIASYLNRREMTAYLLSKTPSDVLFQQADGIRGALFLQCSIKSQMLDIALTALDRHGPRYSAPDSVLTELDRHGPLYSPPDSVLTELDRHGPLYSPPDSVLTELDRHGPRYSSPDGVLTELDRHGPLYSPPDSVLTELDRHGPRYSAPDSVLTELDRHGPRYSSPDSVLTELDRHGPRYDPPVHLMLMSLFVGPRLDGDEYKDSLYNALLWSLSMAPEIFRSSGVQLGYWQRWIYSCIQETPVTANGIQYRSQPQSKLRGFVRRFKEFLGINQVYDLKMMHAYSSSLLDRACDYVSELDERKREEIGIEAAFINAIKFGTVEIIVKMVEIQPYLLQEQFENENDRNLIMLSILNRQEKIFSIWYGLMGTYHSRLWTGSVDRSGNTVLHLAGMLSPFSVSTRIPGAALQMQRELQWFKEVESIVHPVTKFKLNIKNDTPEQVFSKSHMQLVKDGEKWMKDTATSYTVVAALIITVTFAAAFTVPGGNVQDIGIPVFLHKKAFQAFIFADAISLFSSSTSVLMFLGILTSRYAEQDFLKSLPTKLIIGISMLFISITAMMVAFCAALMVTLCGRLEIIIVIAALACVPVILFMSLQCPLLVEMVKSTYGPGIFDRKMKI